MTFKIRFAASLASECQIQNSTIAFSSEVGTRSGKAQTTTATLHERSGRLCIADGDSTAQNMLVYATGKSLDDLAALEMSAVAVLRSEHERLCPG